MKGVIRFFATLGPCGHAPFAPATVGSAAIALIGWFIPPPALPITLTLLAVATALAIWIAGEAEQAFGHDGGPIVVDEAIGQSIALLFVPHSLVAFAVAFFLFRVFDVWKPLGAREIQKLPGGYGVVADDIIAGLTACGAFHAGAWFARSRGWLH